jgi:hypothetical protein
MGELVVSSFDNQEFIKLDLKNFHIDIFLFSLQKNSCEVDRA